jgi:putative Mg2+ transporter-C (MgtC) family protein
MDYLRGTHILSVMLKLMLATLFGGIIGMERGKKNRPAGLRTYVLVCIGSTLAMLTNQYIIENMGYSGDPSRLGAQVINGIGFLGAGTILVTGKQQVKGLTTAAGLWASACMGLAIGIGYYEGAIIAFCFIFGGMTILNKLDNSVLSKSRLIELYVELHSRSDFKEFLAQVRNHDLKVTYIEKNKINKNNEDGLNLFITVQQLEKRQHQEVVDLISQIEVVKFVEEI